MSTYEKLYYRKFRERVALRTVRQMRRLMAMKLPIETLLLLIAAILFPSHVTNLIRK